MAGTRVIDLSLTLAEELPCSWATHMPFQHKTFTHFGTDPRQDAPLVNRPGVGAYQTRWMLIDEHTGTHVDAPAHFIPAPGGGVPNAGPAGTVTVEQLPLEQMMGSAVVVDATGLPAGEPGVSPRVGEALLLAHERRHGRFEPGQIVLIRGDWDRHYLPGEAGLAYGFGPLVAGDRPGWPALDVPALELLLGRGVVCVGTDAPSLGPVESGAELHRAGLSQGCVFLEGLANLRSLPPTGAWFCFAPLRLARGTGAPGRAFAVIPDDLGSA